MISSGHFGFSRKEHVPLVGNFLHVIKDDNFQLHIILLSPPLSTKYWAGSLEQVTIYRRLWIGRDGRLDQTRPVPLTDATYAPS